MSGKRQNVEDIFPLSPMQRLMLTHDRSLPGSYMLSNQFRYDIEGELNADRLEATLRIVSQRHPALRTSFFWEGLRDPVQIVRPLEFKLQQIDLSDLSADSAASRLAEIVRLDRLQAFDLREPPLSRFTLIKLAGTRYHLMWSRHHMILDRWCVDILFDELFRLYAMGDAMQPDSLPRPARFRDYIAWIGRQSDDAARHYWAEQLRGVARPSQITRPGRGRSGFAAEGAAQTSVTLGIDQTRACVDLAKSSGVSLSVVLQAALAMVFACRDRTDRVVYGMTVSGRPTDLAGVESILGSFINDVPAVVHLHAGQTLTSWFMSIQKAQAERSRFDYLSLTDIRAVSDLETGQPLYELLALFDSPPTEGRQGAGFRITQLPGAIDTAAPMTVSLSEQNNALSFAAAYDPVRVEQPVAAGLLNALVAVLDGFTRHATLSVGDLRAHIATTFDFDSISPASADQDEVRVAALPARHEVSDADLLKAIWTNILDQDSISLDDDFFALGGSSLQAVELFAQIEAHFGLSLPMSVLFEAGSIRSLLTAMKAPAEVMPTLVPLQSNGRRTALFCVPGIGGDPVSMAGLARALGSNQPMYSFLSRGLDGLQRPHTRIEDIAAENIRAMGPEQLSKAFVLCGICWGAFVALEMARQLQASGTPPAILVVFDPALIEQAPQDTLKLHPAMAQLRFLQGRLATYRQEFTAAEKGARIHWVTQKISSLLQGIRQTNDNPDAGRQGEIRRERVMSANTHAQLNYQPQPYSGDIEVILTADRQLTEADPRSKWIDVVAPEAPIHRIPGTDTGEVLAGANVRGFSDCLMRITDRLS